MSRVIKHPKTGQEFLLDTQYAGDNPFHGAVRSSAKARKYIVVHHTAGNTAGDLLVLRGRSGVHVSVKYLVSDPGDGAYRDSNKRLVIWQLLNDEVIGWSIGATTGTYGYVENANSDSIEISNLGTGKDVFEAEQVAAVEALIAYEEKRVGAEVSVFGHREVAPGRKVDPHTDFPLDKVQDFAAWVHPGTEDDMAAKNHLIQAFVRPEQVPAVTAALADLGVRVYDVDVDKVRITRKNPSGTAQ